MLQNERLQFRHFVRLCLNLFQPGIDFIIIVFYYSEHLQELRLVEHVRIDFVILQLFKHLVRANEIGVVHYPRFNTNG